MFQECNLMSKSERTICRMSTSVLNEFRYKNIYNYTFVIEIR